MTTDTATTERPELSDSTLASAAYSLRDLTTLYRKHIAWQVAAITYSKALRAGLNPDEPKLSSMPSKAAKHRMYGEAGRLVAILRLDMARPTTLAEIGELIHVALKAL